MAAIIGAIPVGLVNLSVVESTLNRGEKSALLLSTGASAIEISFVLIAIFPENSMAFNMENKDLTDLLIILVLLAAEVYFLLTSPKNAVTLHSELRNYPSAPWHPGTLALFTFIFLDSDSFKKHSNIRIKALNQIL